MLGLFALLLTSVSAVPFSQRAEKPLVRRGGDGQNADKDPFYTPDAGFQNNSLGTVLRSRQFNVTLDGKPISGVSGYQLLYLTQGANTTTYASVTTIFQPSNFSKDRLVSYQIHEDADSTACAFSYEYYAGLNSTDTENLFISAFLAQNYTVVVSDYEGPDSAFIVGPATGKGVLDSIRAALSFKTLGLANDTAIVGVGYSGGGHASGWAAAIQPTYAPELRIAGWSMGGTPSDIQSTFYARDGGLYAYFSFVGAIGLGTGYSAFGDYLQSKFTPAGLAIVQQVYNSCLTQIPDFAYKSFLDTKYQTVGATILDDPIAQTALTNVHLGVNATLTPSAPVLMAHTATDEIVPFNASGPLYNNFCSHGVKSLEYIVNTNGAGHQSTEFYLMDYVFRFVNARFENSSAPVQGCNQTNVSLPFLDPSAAPAGLASIYTAANQLINTTLGAVNDSIVNDMLQKGAEAISAAMASATASASASASSTA